MSISLHRSHSVAEPSPQSSQLLLKALTPHLISPQALERREKRGVLSSGFEDLNALLGGGWPRGGVSTLAGPRSSGRKAILLRAIATTLRAGEAVALIDVEGGLDVQSAQHLGIPLQHLLWVQSGANKALSAAELVLNAGGFGLVVLDFGDKPARIPSATGLRLKRTADKQDSAVVVSAVRKPQGLLGACSIRLASQSPHFADRRQPLFLGFKGHARAERKPRSAGVDTPEHLSLDYWLPECADPNPTSPLHDKRAEGL